MAYVYKNRFLDIFNWPNFFSSVLYTCFLFQVYCTLVSSVLYACFKCFKCTVRLLYTIKIGSMKNVSESVLISVHQKFALFNTSGVIIVIWRLTSVEQLNSGANCLIPDVDPFQLFHTSQITIIMDPAD